MDRRTRTFYELQDVSDTPLDDQFYQDELTPVSITSRTTYKIDKILEKRVSRDIREHIVR